MAESNHDSPSLLNRLQNLWRKAYERFLKIRGTPHEIAFGFAIGLFVGMSPTMGVQMPIAIFIAALLKCNKVSAAAGVWISNPFTAPVLYGMTYFIGAQLTGIQNSFHLSGDLDFHFLFEVLLNMPEILWALVIGGAITGVPIAIIGYYFSFSAVNRYQENIKPQIAKQKERFVIRKAQKKSRRTKRKKR